MAKDGKEALKIFSEQDFDLVITDLGMPGMSGWELTKQIKQRKSEIPVVIITGWGTQLSAEDMKKNKVDLILSKPFILDQVKQIIDSLFAARGFNGENIDDLSDVIADAIAQSLSIFMTQVKVAPGIPVSPAATVGPGNLI